MVRKSSWSILIIICITFGPVIYEIYTPLLLYVCTGYLYITGRIKEILITRGGENIAPVPIEEIVLECCKLISYCIVIGDGQRYITALMSLRCEVSGLKHESHTHTHTTVS